MCMCVCDKGWKNESERKGREKIEEGEGRWRYAKGERQKENQEKIQS